MIVAALRAARAAAVGVALGALVATSARAAHDELPVLPSAAQQCLTSGVGNRPSYPAASLAAGRSGSVRAVFGFDGPDRAPSVKFEASAGEDFEAAVRAYASALRVPCLPAGASATLVQAFDFSADDGGHVAATAARDVMDDDRKRRAACLVQSPGYEIVYPPALQRKQQEGRVVLRLHFADPARAPEVETLDDGGSKLFVKAAQAHLETMRLPCLGADPVDALFTFTFNLEGGRELPKQLGELDLGSFVKSIRPVPQGSVYFDTRRMNCPFDVRLELLQPFAPNRVEVAGDDMPARRAFLDWIGGSELTLGAAKPSQLLGHDLVIHVPCAKIQL